MSGDILVITGRSRYCRLISAQDASKHPMMHRTAPMTGLSTVKYPECQWWNNPNLKCELS